MPDLFSQILTQLGTTAVVMAIAGWMLRTWIAHDLALNLEAVRAEWAKDVARLSVHENYLHTRRVALIEEMHREAVAAEFSLQNFLVGWWAFTNRDELLERGVIPHEHFDDDASPSIETRGLEFCKRYLKINSTLHTNAIFFDEAFTEAVLAAYTPFFDVILGLDYAQLPPMPEEYKNVVEAGRAPRRAVVGLFRTVLGVTERKREQATA